jgi:hypothetical protein
MSGIEAGPTTEAGLALPLAIERNSSAPEAARHETWYASEMTERRKLMAMMAGGN